MLVDCTTYIIPTSQSKTLLQLSYCVTKDNKSTRHVPNAYRVSIGKPEGKNCFKDLGIDARTKLKCILKI